MSGIINWVQDKSLRFFYRFGIHCATHQIRLILISGLVITSLFYPALGIYSSSISPALPNFSSRVLTSLFASNVPSLSFFEDDLVNVWSGHSALRTTQDPVARARCGMEKTVRVERVLLSSNSLDFDSGVINHQTLLATLELETRIENQMKLLELNCLTTDSDSCIHLSPLDLWGHDQNALLSDTDLMSRINNQNISVVGMQIKPSMTLAGRESTTGHGSTIDFAAFLALTYFFDENDCNGSTGHNAWIKALQGACVGSVLAMNNQEPQFLALEFNPETKPRHVSLITVILYLSYIIFFVYFSGSMRRMDTVHSRIGLCFTGLVEILVSTITSLSVCAIGGLRITLIPWGIFPIVIVFVGAENMFRLVDEVGKTRISLPVKERIGLGLSRAGTSNTAKVVSYNTILGIISFFAQGAIRQFCVFAIVVLVAHWFLIHTFFVAVLSIDIQRLELGDLLRQDIAIGSSGKRPSNSYPEQDTKRSPLGRTLLGLSQLANGRAARNVSLLLLLVITATLYYTTLPSSTRLKDEPLSRATILRSKAEQALFESHSDAHQVWRVFNPDNEALVHLRIEYPSLVTLKLKHEDDLKVNRRNSHRYLWSSRTFRLVTYITKVLILPIGFTLTCLYALLLYLLKGTDRLEMRREHEGVQSETEHASIDGHASFVTLPLVFNTDVVHTASNSDGSVIAAISTEGELYIWQAASRSYLMGDTRGLILRSFSAPRATCPISSLAIDEHGTTCVVGSTTGVIGVWYICDGTLHALPDLYLQDCSSPVAQLVVIRFYGTVTSESETSDASERIPGSICIFSVYENNRIVRWSDGVPTECRPSLTEVVEAHLALMHEVTYPLCLFSSSDGALEIMDIYHSTLLRGSIILQAGSSEDLVVDAHISTVKVEDVEHTLVAATTNSGIITLWDGNTGELIHTFEDGYGPVNNVQIIPMAPKACPQCGEEPLCTFSLIHSVGHVVFVDRGILARRCSCPIAQPMTSKINLVKDSPMGRRSRSGSFVSSSGLDQSLRTRSRHASVSNDTATLNVSSFPVSGHGIHSRRGSERDLRRASERLEKMCSPFEENGDLDEQNGLFVPDPTRRLSSASTTALPSIWRNFRLLRLKEATCERGGWGVLGHKVLGLRRKPRSRQGHLKEMNVRLQSLSPSVLDRWEAWTMEPALAECPLQVSPLSSFNRLDFCDRSDSEGRQLSRLAFTRLFPLIIKNSFAIAGFGNSIGMLDFNSV